MYADSLDDQIAELTGEGYEVVYRGETSAQLRKPRRLKRYGLVLFVLLPAPLACYDLRLLIVPNIGLLIVIFDYALQKPDLKYIQKGYTSRFDDGSTKAPRRPEPKTH